MFCRLRPFCLLTLMLAASLITLLPNTSRAVLLVSSRGSNSILRFNESNGTFIDTLVSGGIDSPVGMAIGPDGLLYVVGSGEVTGAFSVNKYRVGTGEFVGQFASGAPLADPADIEFDAAGNVYVSNFGKFYLNQFENTVIRYDADGNLSGSAGNPTGVFATNAGLIGAPEMVFAPNGDLFVSSFATSQVLRFNSSGQLVGSLFSADIAGTGGLHLQDNYLYVTSLLSDRILRFDLDNPATAQTIVNDSALAGGNLAFPSDMLIDADGNLLVTSLGTNQVLKYSPAGAFLGVFSSGNGLNLPGQIIYAPEFNYGDLTGDNFVGQDDMNVILDAWGDEVEDGFAGDFNGDNFIGQDDLNVILAEWGNGATPAIVATPEPSTFVLVTIAGLALAFQRFRRGSR
jgi:sugar lactone lactonase YvrE